MRTHLLVIALGSAFTLALIGMLVILKAAPTPHPPAPPPPLVSEFVNTTISEGRDTPPLGIATRTQEKVPAKTVVTAVKKATICGGADANNFDCYEAYYAKLEREKGTPAAFADLRARYRDLPQIRAWCHPLTHVIGRAASEKFSDVADAYLEGDSFCWSGYYHGVMEGVIDRIGSSTLPSKMDSICSGIAARRKYSFDHYNCAHGLGHGVMAVTDDELFTSLATCDALHDGWEQLSCWSGVFMENIIADGINHTTKYLKPEEPLYPCSAVDNTYKTTCYLMQTSYMLKVTGESFPKVFELCSTVGDAYRSTCYESLGRDISGRSTSNVRDTVAGCGLGTNEEQRTHCIIGAVKDFISYFHGMKEAQNLCNALTEDAVRGTCFDTIGSYSKVL